MTKKEKKKQKKKNLGNTSLIQAIKLLNKLTRMENQILGQLRSYLDLKKLHLNLGSVQEVANRAEIARKIQRRADKRRQSKHH